MTVGPRIKALRKQRKLTLKALGQLTELSPSFLCDVEQERTKPSLKGLETIAEALGTSVAYLMGEEEYSEKTPAWILELLRTLSASQDGIDILRLLADLDTWSESDRQELIQYLKIKQLLRNNKESGA